MHTQAACGLHVPLHSSVHMVWGGSVHAHGTPPLPGGEGSQLSGCV